LEKKKQPKNQININPIKRLFENPQKSLEPYVRKGQVVADLACLTGYYTLALAECVGPEGKVYAVDLDEKAIQEVQRKVDKSARESARR
jgi:ubiquinone/menaquinone biosynthesis C-methylase UbiE